MGRSIVNVLHEKADANLIGAIEYEGSPALGADSGVIAGCGVNDVAISAELEAALEDADVLIDFSLPSATDRVLDACRAAAVPLVLGTTGLSSAQRDAVHKLGETLPIVWAPNFSQGVTVLYHLAARAASLLGADFQPEVTEIHHRHKVDSPSGTAVRLGEIVAEARGSTLEATGVYGREGHVGARTGGELGMFALRGGDVVGEHTLFLFGEGERLEITHRATDRMIFARGAVRAAQWVGGQAPGVYDMFDVMGVQR